MFTAPITDHTAQILDLMDGDPIHEADREEIVTSIVRVATEHDGYVDPNQVRDLLTHNGELLVYPRLIGAVYQGLTRRGVLTFAEWVPNLDARGRNVGKLARAYWLPALRVEAAA